MLKVVVIGYGKIAQSLILGMMQTNHKLVGVMRWKRKEENKLYSFLKDTFVPDPILSMIRTHNFREIKARRANSKEFIREIKKLRPDVIIVGSWGEILKKEIIDLPKVAFINCHPSLLPKHRGSNPYASVIRAGETKTGITFHLMNEQIDAGDILLQAEVPISEIDTGETLKNKCAYKVKETLKILLSRLEKGDLIPVKQEEAEASYFSALNEDDAVIKWDRPAVEIHNHIRGLYPWVQCYIPYKNSFLIIKSTRVVKLNKPVNKPGMILKEDKNGILMSTGDPDKAILCKDTEVYNFLYSLKNMVGIF